MIRLTFITNNVRGEAIDYATDNLGEALAADALAHFTETGPDAWVFAFVVEKDDHRMTREQVIGQLEDMVTIERHRADR